MLPRSTGMLSAISMLIRSSAWAVPAILGWLLHLYGTKDWAKYMDTPYSYFQGERGFDDMDDHITDIILRDRKHSVPAMQSCAANAYHFLMRESPEPGTAEAYRMFLATVEVMYKIGAAIELCRLGYKFEKVNLT